mmetsp:Transcript_28743/g.37726  ORF Transcript_28743/g.37726 Transcript_28743/m.37726 type:complete len:759 (+) Transcript_28743:142-2418(+)
MAQLLAQVSKMTSKLIGSRRQPDDNVDNDIPLTFICPITQELMKDPVIDNDGNSYEREAIEDWVRQNGTSPITRAPLSATDLRPNRNLLDCIEEFLQRKAGEKAETVQANASADNNIITDQNVGVIIEADNGFTSISVQPPDGNSRTPCDICCVVDTSGSMSSAAKMASDEGDAESHGFSILDIVKHGLRTIIHTLTEKDRLALVSYNSSARQVFGLIQMTNEGKKTAEVAMEALAPGGQTNIWDGLLTGMEILRSDTAPGRFASLCLLTDGLPNIVPPRGHLPMLQRYRDQHQQLPCRINTFGFGYSLDSKLLSELAVEGGGMYSFIPDCSFVGTIFVNSLSTTLSTFATEAKLDIEITNGAQIEEPGILGGYPSQTTGWGVSIDLGSLNFGQTKDVILPLNIPERDPSTPYLELTLRYTNVTSGPKEVFQQGTVENENDNITIHKFRLKMVDCLRQAIELCRTNNYEPAQQAIASLCSEMRECQVTSSLLSDLLVDLEGESTLAVSSCENFEKWGKHYLPSLMQAHLLQQCNNFKDPGVQHYAGRLFSEIRDVADDAFCKLPPPKPSRVTVSRRSAAPVSMSYYNNAANPCFAEDSLVMMSDRSFKKVKSIISGDEVWSKGGKSTVRCVVKTKCIGSKAHLANINGLLVTPYHPIKIGDEWQYPCAVAPIYEYDCEAVYSFVLDKHHTMVINGTECVSLGHGLHENAIVEHAYFGTKAVLQDLEKMEGWNSGLVHLQGAAVVRDDETGKICRLLQL